MRYMQTALMVIEEGSEARTINLCQQCYNEKLVQEGKQQLKLKEWKEVLEKKAHRGRFCVECGSVSLSKGYGQGRADAAQEKQEGKRGQWQQESPFKEVSEQAKRSSDTDCGHQTLRGACSAMKHGSWESSKEDCWKEGKFCEWTFERLREVHEKVAMDDIGRLSIAQGIPSKTLPS